MTMIERVARVTFAVAEKRARMAGYTGPEMKWETESEALHGDWRAFARAAIAAMRESTSKMFAHTAELYMPSPGDVWKAMIDDALAEKPDEHRPLRA